MSYQFLTYWIKDIDTLRAKLNLVVETLDKLKMNESMKIAILDDLHTCLRVISKGKPK